MFRQMEETLGSKRRPKEWRWEQRQRVSTAVGMLGMLLWELGMTQGKLSVVVAGILGLPA